MPFREGKQYSRKQKYTLKGVFLLFHLPILECGYELFNTIRILDVSGTHLMMTSR